ncbi:unnamed protein product, partial [Scytosiphon promiscuus]
GCWRRRRRRWRWRWRGSRRGAVPRRYRLLLREDPFHPKRGEPELREIKRRAYTPVRRTDRGSGSRESTTGGRRGRSGGGGGDCRGRGGRPKADGRGWCVGGGIVPRRQRAPLCRRRWRRRWRLQWAGDINSSNGGGRARGLVGSHRRWIERDSRARRGDGGSTGCVRTRRRRRSRRGGLDRGSGNPG